MDAAPYVPRSRSREITFQQDLQAWQEVRSEVARLARLVAAFELLCCQALQLLCFD